MTTNYTYNVNKQGGKVTNGQIKKNVKQMTLEEKSYLKAKLYAMTQLDRTKITMTQHCLDKGTNMSLVEMMSILEDCTLIDFNYNTLDESRRVVIRSNKIYKVTDPEATSKKAKKIKSFCKLVIDIDTNTIITTWMNKVEDEEKKNVNLNMSRYDANLQIIK